MSGVSSELGCKNWTRSLTCSELRESGSVIRERLRRCEVVSEQRQEERLRAVILGRGCEEEEGSLYGRYEKAKQTKTDVSKKGRAQTIRGKTGGCFRWG